MREKKSIRFNAIKWWPLILVIVQVILGIATVLTSPQKIPQRWGNFEWNALLHQIIAMFLLLCLVMAFYLLSAKERSKSSHHFDKHII